MKEFEDIRWERSSQLLDHVGAEQNAFLEVRAAAASHLPDLAVDTAREGPVGGAVITVSGGPGSGKTALAVRLLGHLMRAYPTAHPCFITPSGTLRAHLLDAVGGHSAARELFPRSRLPLQHH